MVSVTVCVRWYIDGVQFMPVDKKHYWRHDAYIPMPSGDFPAEM